MAQKVLKQFRGVVKHARRRGLIAPNLAGETRINASGRHKRRLEVGFDIPKPTEIKALVDTAAGKACALVCLAAFAGLRAPAKSRGLRWADLDLGSKPTVTFARRSRNCSRLKQKGEGFGMRRHRLRQLVPQLAKQALPRPGLVGDRDQPQRLERNPLASETTVASLVGEQS